MESAHAIANAHLALQEDKVIYVLGPIQMQNSLMGSFLEQAVGAKCFAIENPKAMSGKPAPGDYERKLILWDCYGKNAQECVLDYRANAHHMSFAESVALFNVAPGLGIEERIIGLGAHGFFYREDPLDKVAKGVKLIFDGELWISRSIMARYIRKEGEANPPTEDGASLLTGREAEILVLVASGATNAAIAEKLFLSHHTVKTHLYNIFKKINVPNRLQAAFWATKNL